MTNTTEETALGIILGSAVGDALGAPLEFLPPRSGDNLVTEMEGGGVLKWKPGEITDDTIMSLAIQEMYLEKGKYDQSTIINKWIDWMDTNPKDIGNWTYKVLSIWKNTDRSKELRGDDNPAVERWKKTGRNSAGNGALMRCMPSAVVHHDNALGFVADTLYLAEDTHPDPRCILSCIALNTLLKLAFECLAKDEALNGTIKVISTLNVYTDNSLIVDTLEKAPTHETDMWENTGYTVDTLYCAVAAWYQNESFEEGLIKVINRGGDADTVAAVAGSLLGAYHGVNSIPERWLNTLIEKDRLAKNAVSLLSVL